MPLWEQIAHRLRCRDEDFPRILSLTKQIVCCDFCRSRPFFIRARNCGCTRYVWTRHFDFLSLPLDTANNASMRHTWGSSMHCENWSTQRAEQKRRKPCSMESYRAAVFSTKGIKLASSWERYSCRTEIKERVQC